MNRDEAFLQPMMASRRAIRGVLVAAVALAWTCAARASDKATAPIPAATVALMTARNTGPSAPVLLRVFKKEAELEIWKQARDGRYVFIKTFPICRWSGQLGPKQRQGDRQTPEGFYPVAKRQLNPNSAYYLSFDTGFPNAYDRAHGYSGSALMVHGTCSSAGCFAMTDRQVGEIYAIVRDALNGGQAAFQFQSFPFRMSALNLARHRSDPNIGFWRQLKEGSDRFEATGEEPVVSVKDGRYAFAPSKDAAREASAQVRLAREAHSVADLVTDGAAAVRTTYSDGGQNPTFAALMKAGAALGDVSRPEALPLAGQEIVLVPARTRRPLCKAGHCPIEVAMGVGADVALAALVSRNAIGGEPSLFSGASFVTPTAHAAPTPGSLLPGAVRIVPGPLASARFEIASAR